MNNLWKKVYDKYKEGRVVVKTGEREVALLDSKAHYAEYAGECEKRAPEHYGHVYIGGRNIPPPPDALNSGRQGVWCYPHHHGEEGKDWGDDGPEFFYVDGEKWRKTQKMLDERNHKRLVNSLMMFQKLRSK